MRVLFVASRFPHPPLRGDQVRAFHQLRLLAPRHRISVISAEPGPRDQVPCAELIAVRSGLAAHLAALLRGMLAGRPAQAAWFETALLRRAVKEQLDRGGFDVVHVQLARLAAVVPEGVPRVIDLIDALSLNMTRRREHDRGPMAWVAGFEAPRLLAWERRVCASFERATVVSDADRQAIGVPALAVNPNGVDLEAWPFVEAGRQPDRVVFTGNLGYFPNRDAARWLFAEIWPPLRAARPELELLVAGDRPGRELRVAAARAGATLVASPPSLVELLAGASVALAPLRGGSGVPVKVLEAWAAGVPVVASPWAVAGLAAEGEAATLEGAVRVADAPADWVAAVGQLLDDAGGRERQVAAGRARVLQRHSPAQVGAAWREAVERASRAKRDVQAEFGSVK